MYNIIYFPLTILAIFFTRKFMNKYEFYDKWRKLNCLVSCKTKNKVFIQYYSLQLLLYIIWRNLLVYFNNSVKQCGKNRYEVSYILHNKTYKVRINVKRGPIPIYKICDGEQNDITDMILSFMGPNYDWHNNIFTPEDLGFESIIFELSNGNVLTFRQNDKINIEF